MDYIEAPHGRIRIPDGMSEPTYATKLLARPRGAEVSLLFVQEELDPSGAADGAVGEVVAHIFMPRENWERLVEMLPEGLNSWRKDGL